MSFLGVPIPPIYPGQGSAVASNPVLLIGTYILNVQILQEKPIPYQKDQKIGGLKN